jgi:hypothetical protein
MKARLTGLVCAAVALLATFVTTMTMGAAAQAPGAGGARRGSRPTAAGEQAVSVADYRARLGRAARSLEELAAFCRELERGESGESWSGVEFDPNLALELPAREENTLTAVGRLLPPVERVEAGGQSQAADNRWLAESLVEYERQSVQLGYTERAEALGAAAGRLRALEDALGGEAAAVARDREAEKGRLANILRRPEFDKETAQGGALQRLVEDAVKWLRGIFPDIKPLQPGTGARVSQAAQYLVFGLCLVVLAYLGWRLLRARGISALRLERRRGPRVVLGERLEQDQTAADLLEEAERMALSGDARGAIRKAYVALLVELGDRGVIGLAQHKTNRDYLRAAREEASRPLYEELLPLTTDYERHWYGVRPAGQSEWLSFRDRCRRALGVV